MRNPDRIKPFLGQFEKLWLENSDLRFGQLVHVLSSKIGRSLFFPEEDEWLEVINKEMVDKSVKSGSLDEDAQKEILKLQKDNKQLRSKINQLEEEISNLSQENIDSNNLFRYI